nr:hypothetical protein DVH24_042731 [Ipomoea batatas]
MSVAILLTWIADGCPMNGSVVITTSLSPMAKSTDLAGDLNSKHDSIYKVKLKRKRGITGDVTAPNSAVVTAVGAKALAIVGIPDGRGVILGAGKEQITIPVVLEKRQWPLVPFHQYRPHLSGCGFPIRRQRKRSLKKTLVAALHLNQKQQRMRNRQNLIDLGHRKWFSAVSTKTHSRKRTGFRLGKPESGFPSLGFPTGNQFDLDYLFVLEYWLYNSFFE